MCRTRSRLLTTKFVPCHISIIKFNYIRLIIPLCSGEDNKLDLVPHKLFYDFEAVSHYHIDLLLGDR